MNFDCNYPFKPPKVYAMSENFYHPNLDLGSKQMIISILDMDDWSPVIGINQIFNHLEKILINFDKKTTSLQSLEAFEKINMQNTIDYLNTFCNKVSFSS